MGSHQAHWVLGSDTAILLYRGKSGVLPDSDFDSETFAKAPLGAEVSGKTPGEPALKDECLFSGRPTLGSPKFGQ